MRFVEWFKKPVEISKGKIILTIEGVLILTLILTKTDTNEKLVINEKQTCVQATMYEDEINSLKEQVEIEQHRVRLMQKLILNKED